jgi:hypothetical protein
MYLIFILYFQYTFQALIAVTKKLRNRCDKTLIYPVFAIFMAALKLQRKRIGNWDNRKDENNCVYALGFFFYDPL